MSLARFLTFALGNPHAGPGPLCERGVRGGSAGGRKGHVPADDVSVSLDEVPTPRGSRGTADPIISAQDHGPRGRSPQTLGGRSFQSIPDLERRVWRGLPQPGQLERKSWDGFKAVDILGCLTLERGEVLCLDKTQLLRAEMCGSHSLVWRDGQDTESQPCAIPPPPGSCNPTTGRTRTLDSFGGVNFGRTGILDKFPRGYCQTSVRKSGRPQRQLTHRPHMRPVVTPPPHTLTVRARPFQAVPWGPPARRFRTTRGPTVARTTGRQQILQDPGRGRSTADAHPRRPSENGERSTIPKMKIFYCVFFARIHRAGV